MDVKELNITKSDGSDIVFRTGAAAKVLDPQPPVKTDIKGTLNTPLIWLQKKSSLIVEVNSNIQYSLDDKSILLTIQEDNFYNKGTILGTLQMHSDNDIWQINEPDSFDNFDLAKLIRMNRSAFNTQKEADDLVHILQNFQANVAVDIEKANNNRGDKKLMRIQAVKSNLPESFRINVGIFKGYEKKSVLVSVDVDADTFQCSLVSPEYKEFQDMISETAIKEVLEDIVKICPGIAIIEV